MSFVMRFVIAVLLLITQVSLVSSQGVQMPDRQPLPRLPMLDANGEEKLFCWIASEDVRPKYTADLNAEEVFASSAFGWMETLYVMAECQVDGESYVLVAKPRGTQEPKIEGWVNKGLLIIGKPMAKRVVNDGDDESVVTSRLFQKVRLSNTGQSLKTAQANQEQDVSNVPVYRNPSMGEATREIALAALFYVYGEHNGFVLVGRTERFQFTENKVDSEDYKDHVVIGWVPGDRVVRWNTRQAIAWNWWSTHPNAIAKRKTPGFIFGQFDKDEKSGKLILSEESSLELAESLHKRFVRSPSIAGEAEEILYHEPFEVFEAQEIEKNFINVPSDVELKDFEVDAASLQASRVSKPMLKNEPRHPILEKYVDLDYPNVLYRIGYSAGFSDPNIDLPEFQAKLTDIRDAVKKLDLMVLVDQTSSMKECFPKIAEAVALIFRGVIAGEAKDVRISVSYYGDQQARAEIDGNGISAFEINSFVSLQADQTQVATEEFLGDYLASFTEIKSEQDFDVLQGRYRQRSVDSQLVKMLRDIHFHSFQGGGDPLEDVLKGLQYASRADFRSQSMKLVLVIGDRGDKSGRNNENFSSAIKQIAGRFSGGPNNLQTDFLAINVDKDENHPDAILFDQQMNDLQRQLDPDSIGSVRASNTEALANIIKQVYDGQIKRMQELESDILKLGEGEFSAQIGPQNRRILESQGIDIEKLRNTQGNEIFQEGFTWHFEPETGISQIREQVLLKESELCELIELLDRSFGETIFNEELNGRIEALIKAIEISSGQKQDQAGTLEDILKLSFELPCSSPLMRLTEANLYEKSSNEEGRKWLENEYNMIRLKLARLKDLCEVDMDSPDRRLKPSQWREWYTDTVVGSDGVLYTSQKARAKPVIVERAFSYPYDETGTRWYWIDLLEEYP